ncbi:S10 family peptidase [Thalassoroseus pseudoceratinae]|uniref:S10 family peptidase n=1 Tax=Thalassoroseus pseudoceratinae TaxID=2713176 RepID=UPI0014203846|nr:peptidase S10 [Thalassoroseus pseudoceratinae]
MQNLITSPKTRILFSLVVGCFVQVSLAQDEPGENAKSPVQLEQVIEVSADPQSKPRDSGHSITQHTAKIGDKTIAYEATAGTLPLVNDEGKKTAEVFFVAYVVNRSENAKKRPLTFCFNGGPGSSSVWLHLGMLGPKRVKLNDNAKPEPVLGKLVNNPHSLLDVTDLVFIDPVSTGYSRPEKDEKKSQFHGYREDLNSVGQFIHHYVTKYNRWQSPKYLCGESYGTLRAAGLADRLRSRYYLELNGIVLISSVLDFQTIRFGENNDLPYIAFLPSYAATAWYHKQLADEYQSQPLTKFLREVEEFTLNDYATALLKGDDLPNKTKREIADKIAAYTGLSRRYVLQSNLRIRMSRFAKELMRREDETVGRLDSRYKGADRDSTGDSYSYDPSSAALSGAYTSAMYHYLRTELKTTKTEPYEILSSQVHPWSYKPFENRYVSSTESLRSAMTENPFLKVFVASGYYDLATPYYGTVHTFRHLMLRKPQQENVTLKYYRGGHMMYVHEPSLKTLKSDLVEFYRE